MNTSPRNWGSQRARYTLRHGIGDRRERGERFTADWGIHPSPREAWAATSGAPSGRAEAFVAIFSVRYFAAKRSGRSEETRQFAAKASPRSRGSQKSRRSLRRAPGRCVSPVRTLRRVWGASEGAGRSVRRARIDVVIAASAFSREAAGTTARKGSSQGGADARSSSQKSPSSVKARTLAFPAPKCSRLIRGERYSISGRSAAW